MAKQRITASKVLAKESRNKHAFFVIESVRCRLYQGHYSIETLSSLILLDIRVHQNELFA